MAVAGELGVLTPWNFYYCFSDWSSEENKLVGEGERLQNE